MKIEFHPLADRELSEAGEFYEAQADGLGADFVAEVERLLEVLATYPYIGRPAPTDLRTIPVRRFPYSLIYRVLPDVLRILAVAHHRRRPRYWAGRSS